jgi:hypothetical protein
MLSEGFEEYRAQGGSVDVPQRQKGTEGPRWWMAVISEEMRPEEATTGKRGKYGHNFQENHKTRDCRANCQIYCWVAEDKGLAPSEEGKEAVHGVGSGDVGASPTPGVMALPVGKKKKKYFG